MAIIWTDGFDDYTSLTGEFSAFVGMSIAASQGRRSGSGALFCSSFNAYAAMNLDAVYTELYLSFAFRPTELSTSGIIGLLNAGVGSVALRLNADGSISAMRGTFSGTLLGTSAPGLVLANVYTHVQLRVVFSATVGVVQMRVNGSITNAINLTGQNTNAGADRVSFLTGSSSNTMYWDDVVVCNTAGTIANSWPGDVRVDTYFPNASGDLSQMVGSDGNSTDNHLLVDAAAPNGTDYVQTDVLNNEDLYNVADITHTPTTIYGVMVTASARKDDAGTRAIRLHAKSGAVDQQSPSDIALGTTRARVMALYETDPNTGAPWTKSGFNAAQFGFRVSV